MGSGSYDQTIFTSFVNPSVANDMNENGNIHPPPTFETATCPSFPLYDNQPPPPYDETMNDQKKK
ncbi:hypothetical protein HZS_288 [Henneguya salminicola]|nr:hypothetical protein HZS_288 [Henneguya salminicola]